VASLRRGVSTPEDDQSILMAILEEEALRINCIVSDLLDFARPMELRSMRCSLVELFADLRASLSSRPEAARIAFTFEAAPTLPSIEIDVRLMRQALLNLIANGIQAMPSGGALVVSARQGTSEGGARLLIDVSDCGPGIATADRARIFEPFFTTKATGTGLGLPLVRRVVEAHGGELSVRSSSAGTTFTIALSLDGSRGARRSSA
jgi:signal transduction histidine kinase